MSLGRMKGILTCAHVTEALEKYSPIGLLTFDGSKRVVKQAARLDIKDADFVKIKGKSFGIDGPDLSLILIPEELGSSIAARSTFLNWDRRRIDFEKREAVPSKALSCLVGLIKVWDEKTPTVETKTEKIFTHNGLINIGTTEGYNDIDNRMGNFDFIIDPNDYERFPERYWATSGGGVWKFSVKEDVTGTMKVTEIRFVGVAFYESRTDERVAIRCHGPEAIFKELFAQAKEKWPHAFE